MSHSGLFNVSSRFLSNTNKSIKIPIDLFIVSIEYYFLELTLIARHLADFVKKLTHLVPKTRRLYLTTPFAIYQVIHLEK